jgi:acyl-[acyl-carrier-protein]-phospholipid O-acyltransferase/long-chain-fatty-acid--[acyl-carrier-protein] ligase
MISIGLLLHPDNSKAGFISGQYLATMGGGIILGALTVIWIAKHRPVMKLIPVGGIGMSASLLALALLHPTGRLYIGALLILGIFSSLFIVPLNTFLQDSAAEDRRSWVITATNLLLNLGGITAVALHALQENILQLQLKTQLLTLFAIMTAVSIATCRLLNNNKVSSVNGLLPKSF